MDFAPSSHSADNSRRVFLKRTLAVSATVAVLGNLPRLAQAEPLSRTGRQF
ncbi:twin-arginine translocation signal domain-containing protein [Pseudomonas spelaei]|uniref:twin-arginine translocation signal domain-containing protein n=1 Tax=Pseudomonas spelaei TaxID=1055469 RepID=UPI0036090909